MSKHDSKEKKKAIMRNIQMLRNEIEEIRIQNLTLLENLKPYEQWYEETRELLFSSTKIRRRSESSQPKSLISRYSRNQSDSSSSLSSESSDTENKSQTYENQESSEKDEDYLEEDKLDTKNITSNNQAQNTNLSSQKKNFPSLSSLYGNLFMNSTLQMHNQNGSNTLHPATNLNPLQNSNPNLNIGFTNVNQKQPISPLNNQLSTGKPIHQSNSPYTFPTELHKKETNLQSKKPNQRMSNKLAKGNQSPFRTSPKISQIGAKSMLSNIVSQQKKIEQNNEKNSSIKEPQQISQHIPLSNNYLYIPRKTATNEITSFEYRNNINSYNNSAINSIINMNYNNRESNAYNEYDLDSLNNDIFDIPTVQLDENKNESDLSFRSFININSNINSNENNHTLNDFKSQFDFIIEPPPIPGIQISKRKNSDSNSDFDLSEEEEKQDKQNKQQTNQKTILTPIIKINLT